MYGTYKNLDSSNKQVYSYLRSDGKKTFLVSLNFSSTDATTHLDDVNLSESRIVLHNYPDKIINVQSDQLSLRPWEAIVVELE